jgi:hypothetical protein
MRRTLFIMGLTCVVWGQVRIPGPGGLRASSSSGITLVSSVCGPNSPASGGGSSVAINTTGANFLVQVQSTANTGLWMSDSFSNNWHTSAGTTGTSNTDLQIYYVVNPVVGANHVFTLASGGQYPTFCVYAFSGMDTTAAVFETGTWAGSKVTTTSASVSTTPTWAGNNLIIAGLGAGTAAETYSINSGFATPIGIINTTNAFNTQASFKVETGTATVAPTWTISPSAATSVGIATFKGAN